MGSGIGGGWRASRYAGGATRAARALATLCFVGCAGDPPTGAAAAGSQERQATWAHDFPALDIEAGGESDEWCQQWSPGHEETLFVNWIRMRSGRAYHHMNFFYVPESMLEGPDGTFRCEDRGYNLQLAAMAGGVFFAQSTQADDDLQDFGPGSVIPIPPGYKIVGNQHMLNSSSSDLTTHVRFELGTIPEEDVRARMTGITLSYGALQLPPRSKTEFTVDCDFDARHRESLGRPLDFSFHYMLPHYHELGRRLRVELLGGTRDGEVLVETTALNGESVGVTADPPASLLGATGLRLTCAFENARDEHVSWGIDGGEMCILFAYTDSPLLWASDVERETSTVVETVDGVARSTGDCKLISAPSTSHR